MPPRVRAATAADCPTFVRLFPELGGPDRVLEAPQVEREEGRKFKGTIGAKSLRIACFTTIVGQGSSQSQRNAYQSGNPSRVAIA